MVNTRKKSFDANGGYTPIPPVSKTPIKPSNMKVAELKEELQARGLSPKGLKKELVERLESSIQGGSKLANDAVPSSSSSEGVVEGEEFKSEDSVSSSIEPAGVPVGAIQSVAVVGVEPAFNVKDEISVAVSNGGSLEGLCQSQVENDSIPTESAAVQISPTLTPLESRKISNTIHIFNLVRPFTLPALKDLVLQFGEVSSFALDSFKANCYVSYTTQASAEEAKRKLEGLKWPFESGRKLSVEFATEDELQHCVKRPELRVDEGERHEPIKEITRIFHKTNTEPQLFYVPAHPIM